VAGIDPVEYGALKAEIVAQRRDIERLASEMKAQSSSIGQIERTLAEAKGGWKALAFVAGFSGSLGATIAWLVDHLGKP
jgi:hypothetical protein